MRAGRRASPASDTAHHGSIPQSVCLCPHASQTYSGCAHALTRTARHVSHDRGTLHRKQGLPDERFRFELPRALATDTPSSFIMASHAFRPAPRTPAMVTTSQQQRAATTPTRLQSIRNYGVMRSARRRLRLLEAVHAKSAFTTPRIFTAAKVMMKGEGSACTVKGAVAKRPRLSHSSLG